MKIIWSMPCLETRIGLNEYVSLEFFSVTYILVSSMVIGSHMEAVESLIVTGMESQSPTYGSRGHKSRLPKIILKIQRVACDYDTMPHICDDRVLAPYEWRASVGTRSMRGT